MDANQPADWDPRSQDVLDDPTAAYDAMRKRCPVARSDYLGWSLFRHEDVMRVLQDPETFSNAASNHLSIPNAMDPPEHTPYRQIVERYYEVTESQRATRHDLDATNKAAAILSKGGNRAYDRALRALTPDTREWWQSYVDEEEYPADATGLATFISEHVTPFVYQQEKESRHHGAIVNQALGEGLQAYKLEKLSRYETHLDRKFERTLAMLREMRRLG